MFIDQKLKRIKKPRLQTKKLMVLFSTLLVAVLALVFCINRPGPPERGSGLEQATVTSEARERQVPEPEIEMLSGTVKTGDTISSLLEDFLSPQDIHGLIQKCKSVYPLRKIRARQPYTIYTRDGDLERFEYEMDDDEKLVLDFEKEEVSVFREPIAYDVEIKLVKGTLRSSLFDAVEKAGESPELAIRLADIFAWDVDFLLDIRSGDTFKAVVEKRSRAGNPAGYGRILAAEFVNQGEVHQGFLFQDSQGNPAYYGPEGKSLRRNFLKAPLRFTRISSGFSWSRMHPIKHVRLPHPAVDYAAPVGTPIKAIGDGVVTARGYQEGNGRYIKLRHPNGYETYYLHLSHFARGVKLRGKVRQGQVIGYVGRTGEATGPHLDFRVKKNGRYVNPRKIKAKPTSPVPADKMEAFQRAIEPLKVLLEESSIAGTSESSPSPADRLASH